MGRLIPHIKKQNYTDHILSERQISRLLGGSPDRRYGQVKRAMKSGDLLQLKRGLYVVADQHRTQAIHPFTLSQAMHPGSYISMETALAFHGWIPEAVYETISVTPGRKKHRYQHQKFGTFSYAPLAINQYEFLRKVKRHKMGAQHVLIAEPLRALMDLVTHRKQAWTTLSWIENGLRIERDSLITLRQADFSALKTTYKHKRAQAFLTHLKNEIYALKNGGGKTYD